MAENRPPLPQAAVVSAAVLLMAILGAQSSNFIRFLADGATL